MGSTGASVEPEAAAESVDFEPRGLGLASRKADWRVVVG